MPLSSEAAASRLVDGRRPIPMTQQETAVLVRPWPVRRPPIVALAGSTVCALAMWVSLGVLAVASDASSPRIGLLPPWWVPLVAAVALLALSAHAHVPERAWWPTLIPSVLLLPWLPVPVPAAFLIWTGPTTGFVWAGTLAAVVGAWAGGGGPLTTFFRAPRSRLLNPGLAAFAASLAIFGAAAWASSSARPAGDEPNYLIITQSLLLDGDLQIENNHKREDYAAYYSGVLRPDFLRRGKNRQIYSIHAPGLPALAVPAFAAAGYPGVVAFLVLVSAFGAWLVWRTSCAVAGDAGAAWFGWAAVCLSVPFLCHSGAVFPDGPGAVLVMTGVAALVRLEREGTGGPALRADRLDASELSSNASDRRPYTGSVVWLLHGLALALLPWLHTRFAAAAAVLGACLALRLIARRRVRELLAFALIPVMSAAAWFGFFYAIYGSFDPASPYGSYSQSSLVNLWPGLPALLLDQQYGLLPNAPVYFIAFAGLGLLVRERRRLGLELTVLLLVYLAAVASYGMWWGGWSAPARFAVPALLSLGPCAALFWARAGATARAVALVALALSLMMSVVFNSIAGGHLMFNPRDGVARWLEWVAPAVDLPRAVPSFFWAGPWRALGDAATWVAVMLAAWFSLHLAFKRAGDTSRRLAAASTAAPLLFCTAVMAASSIVWALHGSDRIAPTSAQLRLLEAFDPEALPNGLQLRPLRFRPPGELLTRMRLSASERRPLPPWGPLLAIREVPAGTYRVLRGEPGAPRRLAVRVMNSPHALQECAFERQQSECLVWLPVNARELRVEAALDGTGPVPARRLPRALELQPVDALALSERPTSMRASAASRYGPFTVFAFDNLVFLEREGLWVQGGADVSLVLGSTEHAASMPILVRNGARANTVRLRGDTLQSDLSLAAGEEREISLPLHPRSRAAFLQVHAENGFKPSEVDPSSGDHRYLGVWLQPRTR